MNYRRIISTLSAFAMIALSAGCGQSDGGVEAEVESLVISEDTAETTETSSAADEKLSSETTTAAKTTAKSGKTTTTTAVSGTSAATTAKSSAQTGTTSTKTTSSSSSGNSSSGSGGSSSGGSSTSNSGGSSSSSSSSSSGSSSGGSSSGSSSSSGGGLSSAVTTASRSSGGTSPSTATTAASQQTTENKTTPAEPDTPAEDEYTAKVSLGNSPKVTGGGITVSGSNVTITQSGEYYFSGTLSDGQIFVDAPTEEKVKLVLDGVDITCSTGPAILVNDAKKCTIELADGSENYLTDGAKDKVNDGVIFSNDTLRIKGNGSLEIKANNAHGIASDDDVIIEGGTYVINSKKSGIFAHDDITISGGDLTVFGGTNGLKSKGTLNMKGGKAVVSGGTKEEKSSVYAYSAFNYTGGELYAAGNQVTAPATSANPYIVLDLSASPAAAGSELSLVLDGTEVISFNPHNNYRCVIMLSPDIADGSSFSASIDGVSAGSFTVSGTKNVFKAE